MKKNFLKRTRILQGVTLVCVIFMFFALFQSSGLVPGVSEAADQRKQTAKKTAYAKEYTRGSIKDRNGSVLASSEEPGSKRVYSDSYAFSNVIGYDSAVYGTYGIESTLDTALTHSDCGGGEKRGADVTLTLDGSLQKTAYQLLGDTRGSVVVLDAKTGEILTLASTPSFNANTIDEDWDTIIDQDGVFYSNAYQNAVTPGSVFKLVISKAILEQELDEEVVEDEGALVVDGRTIRNFNGAAYGSLTYEQAFVNSSNVYFMDRALKMGGQALKDAADSFFLGQDIELDFTTLSSTFDLGDYEDSVLAVTAFGQGETLVTPLQMAMITQSIANNGKMMKPYLIESVVNGKGKTILSGEKEILTETMEKSTAKKIRNAMKLAGESYELETVGGKYAIAAKTGTAERGDGTNNAWLVTYAPADSPRYVVVVNRLGTTEIGKSLAPVAEAVYEELFAAES